MDPARCSLLSHFVIVPFVVVTTACQAGSRTEAAPPIELRLAAPSASATNVASLPGLHNVVTYQDGLVCGGAPADEQGMRSLQQMGIKTVISVDGMAPDVELAELHGLRYVHLPISYDTVPPARQQELARAITSCEGPIYMHCHHGKHRSAAALASAVVLCGMLTPEQALARMQVSGTAKEYTGLWQAVRDAKPLPADQLHIDPATLPSTTEVSGMVSMMNEIDQVFDFVKRAQKAGWQAPDEHPDLVASHETARLANVFRRLPANDECIQEAEFVQHLDAAITQTTELDAAVRNHDTARADRLLAALGQSCKTCHATYRDR